MKEGPPKPPSAGREPGNIWDFELIANTLNVSPAEPHDLVLGMGQRFIIPEGAQNVPAEFEFYPQYSVVRYRGQSLQFDLTNVVSVEARDKHLRIEAEADQGRTVLLLEPTGVFTLSLRPMRATQYQKSSPSAVEGVQGTLPTAAEPVPEQAQVAEQSMTQPDQAEKPRRVVLTGRVGRTPEIKTTLNGRAIARMPLAVHEGEKTAWHTIIFFDELAKKATTFGKGETVNVVGYKHQRQVPTQKGMKQVEQIFAAAINAPKPK